VTKRLFVFLFSASFALLSCDSQTKRPPTVAFLSDFGTKDDSVAVCKAVMWEVAPNLRIVDITHDAPPYDIDAAGRVIANAAEVFPAHTVFVAVVDPGVGSERKPIAVKTQKGHFFVGPDNGLFTKVIAQEGLAEAREITNKAFMRQQKISFTFHGRDIFSPTAAHLARGDSFEQVGPAINQLVTLPYQPAKLEEGKLTGIVEIIEEPYGNVITNIPSDLVDQAKIKIGETLQVTIGNKTFKLPYLKTFSDVAEGKSLALLSSRGYLSFSINMGNFAKHFEVRAKDSVVISLH